MRLNGYGEGDVYGPAGNGLGLGCEIACCKTGTGFVGGGGHFENGGWGDGVCQGLPGPTLSE